MAGLCITIQWGKKGEMSHQCQKSGSCSHYQADSTPWSHCRRVSSQGTWHRLLGRDNHAVRWALKEPMGSGRSGAVKNLSLLSYPGKQITVCWRTCTGHQMRQLRLVQSTESSSRRYILMDFSYGSEATLLWLRASRMSSAMPQFPCCVL